MGGWSRRVQERKVQERVRDNSHVAGTLKALGQGLSAFCLAGICKKCEYAPASPHCTLRGWMLLPPRHHTSPRGAPTTALH